MTRDIGDKVGPKLARLIADTIVATKRQLAPHEHRVRVKASQDIIDRAGREVADLYRPIIDRMLAEHAGELAPDVREFLEQAKSGEHQLKAFAGVLMGPVQSALGTFLSNELAPVVYSVVSRNPNLFLDPQTAANAAATGLLTYADAIQQAAGQGYDSDKLAALFGLAEQMPDLGSAMSLVQRDVISPSVLDDIMQRQGIPAFYRSKLHALLNTPLSPADGALGVLKGTTDLAYAEKAAAAYGISKADFGIMLGNTGEPLGLEQLLEAFQRGFIDEQRLTHGILQSRVRNEWIDVAVKLRYSPMSVADAVNAVVQNHMAMADAQAIALQNGLEPGSFDILYETAGEPLSRTEMEELFNRGLATKSQVEQALRESRLKNKYTEQAFELHSRLLEPRMLASAVETGVITHADAIKEAMEYGYSEQRATILVGEGAARKLKTYRDGVVSAALSLYEDNAISDAEVESIIKAMGHEPAEAVFIMSSARYRRQAKIVANAISAIRSKYIGHHITRNQASGHLDSLGVPADRRDLLLADWSIEASANVKTLTTAQVVKAVKLTLITPENGLARLIADGYNPVDAGLLLEGA